MKIGLFADAHYCDKETTCSGTRFPRKSFGKIKNAMEKFRGCDLVISLGDLVDDCDDTEKNIEKIKELTELIRSYGIPFVSLMGNHDYQNFTRSEFDTYTGGAYPPFSMPFGENTLVFLDANFYPDGTAYSRGNVDWKDSNLPENQLEALKKLLREADGDVYIFLHQNLDPEVQEWHIIQNAAQIRELIGNSGKVKKVVQGHYHEGHDIVIDGVEYHTLRAMCEVEEDYCEIMEV